MFEGPCGGPCGVFESLCGLARFYSPVVTVLLLVSGKDVALELLAHRQGRDNRDVRLVFDLRPDVFLPSQLSLLVLVSPIYVTCPLHPSGFTWIGIDLLIVDEES